jgi:hypothetical protein
VALPIVVLALTVGVFPPVLAAPRSPEEAIEGSLELLHDGRFDEADALLARETSEDDPTAAFFRAFVTYWRLLYDEKNAAHRSVLEKRLNRAIALAEGRQKADPSDPIAALYAGSSHLLLAQLRVSEKRVLSAAGEARKAKRSLEGAIRSDVVAADAAFALGTYNYVADRVPAFVKGLRAVLFLPGGDRERGLQQLEQAATRSRSFALESRILLSTIYSSRQEKLFREARRQTELARKIGSGSIAALHTSALLELTLSRPERAAAFLEAASDRASRASQTDRAVLASIAYQKARAEFAMLRPDLARSRLRALLDRPGPIPAAVASDARRLADLCQTLIAAPAPSPSASSARPRKDRPASGGAADGQVAHAWEQALQALELARSGSTRDSLDALVSLAEASPQEPVFAMLAGRALLVADRPKEALPHLLVAARSSLTPAPWQGLSKVLAGFAADRSGRRTTAVELYRKAQDGPPFIGRDAAAFCLQAACTDPL